MEKIKKYPLLIVFFALVLGLAFVDAFVKADQDFSDFENRYLAKPPEITFSAIAKGTFAQKYEEYVNDQFLQRNNFIALKALTEKALGKTENNSVIYGADDYLFEKLIKLDTKQFNKNKDAIIEFIETQTDAAVKVALVPSSYVVLEDKLPTGLPNIDQNYYINEFYSEVETAGGTVLDAYKVLAPQKDEYIYYRTDHHWTNNGALLFYSEYITALGMQPFNYGSLKTQMAEGFAGTYYSKAKPYKQVLDIIEYYDLPLAQVLVEGEERENYYNPEQFLEKDKYAAFLWGNNGHTVLKSAQVQNGQKVLVIKDSYGNSFAPLLTANFEEVHIIDLRAVGQGIAEILEEQQFDEVLILYSFSNFTTDMNVFKMNF